MATATEPDLMCAKCGQNPRAPNHRWCRDCKNEKNREYDATEETRVGSRYFAAGAEAMRAHIIAELLKVPPGALLMAAELAAWARTVDRPPFVSGT